MINDVFKMISLILLVGFISIRSKTRYMVDISLKQISTFLLWTVKYEDREKWIIENQVGYLAKNLSHSI